LTTNIRKFAEPVTTSKTGTEFEFARAVTLAS
jgi:hypothetical protein